MRRRRARGPGIRLSFARAQVHLRTRFLASRLSASQPWVSRRRTHARVSRRRRPPRASRCVRQWPRSPPPHHLISLTLSLSSSGGDHGGRRTEEGRKAHNPVHRLPSGDHRVDARQPPRVSSPAFASRPPESPRPRPPADHPARSLARSSSHAGKHPKVAPSACFPGATIAA